MIVRSKAQLSLTVVCIVLSVSFFQSADASTTRGKSLTVFAASSLSEAFTNIGSQFHQRYPLISIKFSFLASSVLASQIAEGAPADVFASASPRDMGMAKKFVYSKRVFATNAIVMSHLKVNSAKVKSFADLNKSSVRWIQCSPSVACGAATNSALRALGVVKTKPLSYEPKVASVVGKLIEGEVDAAFIYHSDYVANREILAEMAFPNAKSASTSYEIAVVRSSQNAVAAKQFLSFVLSSEGKSILKSAGFQGQS